MKKFQMSFHLGCFAKKREKGKMSEHDILLATGGGRKKRLERKKLFLISRNIAEDKFSSSWHVVSFECDKLQLCHRRRIHQVNTKSQIELSIFRAIRIPLVLSL